MIRLLYQLSLLQLKKKLKLVYNVFPALSYSLFYHTWHLFLGFILDRKGHLKSSLKYSKLLNESKTLYFPGGCDPLLIFNLGDSFICFSHHTFAADIQNI